jgi:hypothetical protein
MDEKMKAAVANLRAATADYPRGTKRYKPKARGVHEQWGHLVPVVVGDLATAVESAPAEKRTKALAELAVSLAKLSAEMVVTVCADDVFDLLDLVGKTP